MQSSQSAATPLCVGVGRLNAKATVPYAGIEAPLKVIGENTPNQLGINLMIHANMEYTNLSKFLPSLCYGENYSVRPISLTLGTTKTTLASGKKRRTVKPTE
jgi:hypothetical protein